MVTPPALRQPILATWGQPLGLCLILFMLSYTIGVVQPIMPPLVREFNSSVGYVQSALVLMSLVTASFTPTAENLSRRLGRRRVLAIALGFFALGLIVIILSPDVGLFTLGLAGCTGIAGAVLMSAPVAMMDVLYPSELTQRYGLVALAIAGVLGALVGSITGGVMAFDFSWRWAFAFELGLIPIIWWLVRSIAVPAPAQTRSIDWLGGLLSVAGFGFTLVGLSLASELGWWQPRGRSQILNVALTPLGISVAPVLIAAGLICLGILVFWERARLRQGEPSLLRLGVFNRRIYTLGLTIGTLHTMTTVGVQFNLFQFIPTVVGLNPVQTAIAVMPFTIAQLAVLLMLVKQRPQVPPRYLLQAGLLVKSVGIAMLVTAVRPPVSSLRLLPALVIMGAGTGLFTTYITSLTFADTLKDQKVEARGVYRPFQNLGASLGRGILGTLLVSSASYKIVDGIVAELGQSVDPAVRRNAVRSLQVAIQTLRRSDRRDLFTQLPDSVQPALNGILQTAAIEAMQSTLLVILALCLLCLGLSFLLPKTVKTIEAPIE
ncbi:MFS transporter [Nodosilinea sp. LEGE 06152]|uniref:MFS transporter n=1 Tax=Nodosilinea sp. LEGE 06152 TaxID=2777966 RepID=UPI001881FB5C|nr:MFS transporter [Nodosilinea sp. LEGE 06152]MBE9157407.1 MFS transporter [Nodosilinea sp. LEGE 06152]